MCLQTPSEPAEQPTTKIKISITPRAVPVIAEADQRQQRLNEAMESATMVVPPNIYLFLGSSPTPVAQDVIHFATPELESVGFCDDFGPMNAATIVVFIERVNGYMKRYAEKKLLYCAEHGSRNFTNAAFLLGSYCILCRNETPDQVWDRLRDLPDGSFEFYRDATFIMPVTFTLSLKDCWSGLARAKTLGWFGFGNADAVPPGAATFDKNEYLHYDNPLNGELHIVVPGKFVAFRGPVDLPDGAEYRDRGVIREFSPRYYVDLFHALGVGDSAQRAALR